MRQFPLTHADGVSLSPLPPLASSALLELNAPNRTRLGKDLGRPNFTAPNTSHRQSFKGRKVDGIAYRWSAVRRSRLPTHDLALDSPRLFSPVLS